MKVVDGGGRLHFRGTLGFSPILLGFFLLLGSLAGCSAQPAHAPREPGPRSSGQIPSTTSNSVVTTTPTPPTTVAPGSLPQTDQLPPSNGAQLDNEMAALFRGIQADSLQSAMPAFFPEAAYLQVKSISNAAGDYENRLVADFSLDIGAAHALLGPSPSSASLVGVDVPGRYAHWVKPATCYNSVGYWEVPNSRVVYQLDGTEKSFGIASMISWRGVWYVVHLGAVLRSSSSGVVDDPASGSGTSAYSSTC